MTSIAYRIARAIKEADPDKTHSIEIMQYSLTIILNTLSIIISTLVIGWLLGEFREAALAMCCSIVLRIASGGVHLRSAWACNVVSTSIFVLIPIISLYWDPPVNVLNIVILLIMILYAPQPDRNTSVPKKWYPWLKLMSILLAASNFYWNSEVIGLAFLIQSLTIIPLRKEGALS